MVDYSRWDKWAENVDSSDDDEIRSKPSVTKFDSGQSVTFGGGKQTIFHRESTPADAQHSSAASASAPASATSIRAANVTNASAPASATSTHTAIVSNAKTASAATAQRKAKKTFPDGHTRNGGRTPRYHWSQTMDTVTCYVFAPAATRGRQVRIALDEKRLRVAVAASDGKGLDAVLVDGLLCGSVRPPSDQDDIDWEMKDVDVHEEKDFAAKTSVTATGLARAVCVTMRKEPMGMGVIHWWKTVMRGDTEIDVTAIPDRRGASMSASSTDRTRALQDSWALAHEQFKARCKQRQKIDVDF